MKRGLSLLLISGVLMGASLAYAQTSAPVWTGEFYDDDDFDDRPEYVLGDLTQINLAEQMNLHGEDDLEAARYTTSIEFAEGFYTFTLTGVENGFRFYIDNSLLLNRVDLPSRPTENTMSETIILPLSGAHTLKVEVVLDDDDQLGTFEFSMSPVEVDLSTETPDPPISDLSGWFLASNLDYVTGGWVTAAIGPTVGDEGEGRIYARVLALDEDFVDDASGIGITWLDLDDVVHAVNLFALLPDGSSVQAFNQPQSVCLQTDDDDDDESVWFLPSDSLTRQPEMLDVMGETDGSYCVEVAQSGLLLLVDDD